MSNKYFKFNNNEDQKDNNMKEYDKNLKIIRKNVKKNIIKKTIKNNNFSPFMKFIYKIGI